MGSENKELKEIKELCERSLERNEDNAILLQEQGAMIQEILGRLPAPRPFTLVLTPNQGAAHKEN
jgi:hypothetical protein